jgi:predicted XRE-type DNA-binding protein
MEKSESIGKLAEALAKAQGGSCRFGESVIIPKILKEMGKEHKSSKRSLSKRFFDKIAFGSTDCWYFTGHIDDVGYGRLAGTGENKAHRTSWMLHNGAIPPGMKVLHRCDVRNCVNPDHLFLGTQGDNVADMMLKGRDYHVPLFGERNPMSKLTYQEVASIREMQETSGLTQKRISEIFNVSPMTISRIVRRESWNV